MKNLNALRDEVYNINKANGWHEEERTFGELIALVHSEVSEALEDYRNGKAINEVWYEYKHAQRGKFKSSAVLSPKALLDKNYIGEDVVLGKPCGIPSELADIVIRILDICGLYGWDIGNDSTFTFDNNISFPTRISDIHLSLSRVYEMGSTGRYEAETKLLLLNLVSYVYGISNLYNINLEQTIQDKLSYNRTRGYKHGGKVI